MVEYAVWTLDIAKAPGIVKNFADQPLTYERFRKEKIVEAEIQRLPNALEMERDGHDGYYCDANILLWRFKIAHGTLRMPDAIVTIQEGANLEPTHRQPVFALEACTGRPRTHRTTNDSI